MKNSMQIIRTPEGIVFSQSLAGPVTRFLAWCIDLMSIGALSFLVATALSVIGLINTNIAGTAFTISYFIISFGYGIFLEWAWRGQTIGKKVLRLRVVDVEGTRLQ